MGEPILAGSGGGIIFSSQDAGLSWQVHSDPPGNRIDALVRDPNQARLLFSGLSGSNSTVRGLYKSADGGQSWSLASPQATGPGEAPTGTRIRQIIIAPSDSQVIYAASNSQLANQSFLYRSTDAGQSWLQLAPQPGQPGFRSFLSLAVDPFDPMTLYAYGYTGSALLLIQSRDGGESWQNLQESPLDAWGEIVLSRSDPDVIVTAFHELLGSLPYGLRRSEDGGQSFDDITPPGLSGTILDLWLDPTDDDRIFVLETARGVYRSEDAGQTWTLLGNHIFRNTTLNSFLVAEDGLVLIGSIIGPYRLEPGGQWTFIDQGLPSLRVDRLVPHPHEPDTILALTPGGIMRSLDGAQSWHPFGFSFAGATDLIYQPGDPSSLFAGFNNFFGFSTNKGQDWDFSVARDEDFKLLQIRTLAADPQQPGVVYAGGYPSAVVVPRVWRSADSGATWETVSDGLEDHIETRETGSVRDLVIDPGDSQTLLAATFTATYRTSDGAQSWQRVEALGIDSFPSLLSPGAGLVYAASSGSGVFKSTDGGLSWKTVNSGLDGTNVSQIYSASGNPSLLFAWVGINNLRISRNGGKAWHSAKAGLEGRAFHDVAVSPADPSRVYVATDRGVIRFPAPDELQYRLDFAQFGNGGSASASIRSEIQLINLSQEESAQAAVSLLDPAGQPMTTDLNGVTVEGTAEFTVPAGGMLALSSDGSGPLQVGSASVVSSTPLSGVVLFESDAGLAGVPSSEEIAHGFLAPLEADAAGGINTGVAVHNLEDWPVDLTLRATDAERHLLAEGHLSLPALGQVSRFVSEVEWTPVPDAAFQPTDLLGRLEVASSGRVAATALQTRPGEFVTLPVTPLAEAFFSDKGSLPQPASHNGATKLLATSGFGPSAGLPGQAVSFRPNNLYFAHFGDGGSQGFFSRLYLLDIFLSRLEGTLSLRGDSGQPLAVDLNGELVSGELELTIPEGGLAILETDGHGPLQTGSVQLTSNIQPAGLLLFSGPDGSAGVASRFPLDDGFAAPMFSNQRALARTGAALFNINPTDTQIEFELRSPDGQTLANAVLTLASSGHRALFVDEFGWQPTGIAALDFSDFRGLLLARLPGRIAATVLLARPGQLATLPGSPLPSSVQQ